jgi:hypothetical protein
LEAGVARPACIVERCSSKIVAYLNGTAIVEKYFEEFVIAATAYHVQDRFAKAVAWIRAQACIQ